VSEEKEVSEIEEQEEITTPREEHDVLLEGINEIKAMLKGMETQAAQIIHNQDIITKNQLKLYGALTK